MCCLHEAWTALHDCVILPVATVMSLSTAASVLLVYCHGAIKWSSSSFWLLTQEALLKVHAFSVPFSSPMQSVQDPTTGDGGTADAAQLEEKMRRGASRVATCLLQGQHHCLCKSVQNSLATKSQQDRTHTACRAGVVVCCVAALFRSHLLCILYC